MKNFIPIPSDLRTSDEMIDLLMNEHCSGYGAFFMIIGFLRECNGYRTKADAKRIAYACQIQDVELTKRVLSNYGLFKYHDDDTIYCPWLTEAMEAYESKRQKRAAAGRASAQARNTSSTNVQQVFNEDSAYSEHESNTDIPGVETGVNKDTNINSGINYEINQPTKQNGGVDIGWDKNISHEYLEEICRVKEPPLSDEQRRILVDLGDEKHNARAVVDISDFFHLGITQARFLMMITKTGQVGYPVFMELLRIRNNVKQSNLDVKFPMNYIISKLRSYGETSR